MVIMLKGRKITRLACAIVSVIVAVLLATVLFVGLPLATSSSSTTYERYQALFRSSNGRTPRLAIEAADAGLSPITGMKMVSLSLNRPIGWLGSAPPPKPTGIQRACGASISASTIEGFMPNPYIPRRRRSHASLRRRSRTGSTIHAIISRPSRAPSEQPWSLRTLRREAFKEAVVAFNAGAQQHVRRHGNRTAAATAVSPFFTFFENTSATSIRLVTAYEADDSDDDARGDQGTEKKRGRVVVEPFALDVVVTHVDMAAKGYAESMASAASTTGGCVGRGGDDGVERVGLRKTKYRDWGELRHCLRSIYNRGRSSSGASLFRNIYIAVASKAHVPSWLAKYAEERRTATDMPRVVVMPHTEFIPRRYLPTFNSHVIECFTHRIPDLARHFVYFNNDMLLGRRLSLFDFLRPVSPERQDFSKLDLTSIDPTYTMMGTDARGNRGDGFTVGSQDDHVEVVDLLLEPVVFFQGNAVGSFSAGMRDGYEEVLKKVLGSASLPVSPLLVADGADRVDGIDGNSDDAPAASASGITCEEVPLKPSALLKAVVNVPTSMLNSSSPQAAASLYVRHLDLYNNQLILERLDGVYPVHRYAHMPYFMDRERARVMLEHVFADVVNHTASNFKFRSTQDIDPAVVYPSFCLSELMREHNHWVMNEHYRIKQPAIGDSSGLFWRRSTAVAKLRHAILQKKAPPGVAPLGTDLDFGHVALSALGPSYSPFATAITSDLDDDNKDMQIIDDDVCDVGGGCGVATRLFLQKSIMLSLHHNLFVPLHSKNEMKHHIALAEMTIASLQPWQAFTSWVFLTFNDDFPEELTNGDKEFESTKTMFEKMLTLYCHKCEPAPWEL